MKLQIALDMMDAETATEIAQQVHPYCDILEIGTLLLSKYGVDIIKKIRTVAPSCTILADCKIADRGKDTAHLMFGASADWVTVLAGTTKDVRLATINAADKNRKKVMMDLLDAASIGQSALDAEDEGIDALLFHQPFDAQNSLAILEQWDMIKGNTKLPIFLSAKINRSNIEHILPFDPYGIVVSEAIWQSTNPEAEAKFFHTVCKNGLQTKS